MATIRSFEELEAWKRARVLVKEVYAASSDGAFGRDLALRDQIRRASISVVSNIAEGFDRGSARAFVQFLHIARGSAAEVRAQLYVALDLGYIDPPAFERLSAQAAEIGRMVSGLIRYLQRSRARGENSQPATRN